MKARIRASLAQTGEDLGLALRRALSGGVARRIDLQIGQRAGGHGPDGPLAVRRLVSSGDGVAIGRGGGTSVGKARGDVEESEGGS